MLKQADTEPDAFIAAHPEIAIVEFLISDLNGILRGKWAPVTALKKAYGEGVNFPLSLFGLDVWGREVNDTGLHIDTGDRDGFCFAVPGTLSRSGIGTQNAAQLILTMKDENGVPFLGDPRQILARQVDLLTAEGLTACAAFELEFFLFDPAKLNGEGEPLPVGHGPGPERQNMYSLQSLDQYSAVFDDITKSAARQGVAVDTIVSEAAPGQFEVNLNHRADVMRATDEAVLLKRIIAECATAHGLKASFMAKPFPGQAGNGMHVHISLLDDAGRNIFSTAQGEALLRYAIAGTLDTMAECTLVFINTINGFRRLRPGSYAPTRAVWGRNNRSVAVRIPASPPSAARLEHRISGADANPYLVMTALLAAMREGLNQAAEPANPVEQNAYDTHDGHLPISPDVALQLFCQSAFAKEAFTPLGHKIICALKQAEIDEFAAEITPLERSTYG
uniref:glutamine synthetase family protein n=1 Tax=Pararhizobium sp. IMCC3301 TaxID=3067904 RepID=UPI002740BBD7|nr:glutamine synthetase family protein [Pararhizobium sp. IMCC3301]